MVCLNEKLDEESICSIYKEEAKATRTVETDVGFNIELKTFNDKIRILENERSFLEQVYHKNKVDTLTCKESDREKAEDKSRDTTRRSRHDATNKVDTNRSEAEQTDNDVDLDTVT